jgi:hypothetical protein
VSWFFEGRDQQRRQAAQWLRTHETGMLVVTGAPGAGKSAFLGDLVVQSNPDLRNALLDLDLVALLPDGSRPDDDVFDAVVHLTGTTPTGLVHELTDAFRTGNPPADKRLDEQTTWLTDRIADLGRRVTILVDALDEAQQPLTIARQVLRPLSRIPGVRVVVGTRTSTSEGPDQPATDTDLLDALGVPADETLPVPRDPDAITRYVRRRLEAACSSPREFRALRPRIEGFSRDIGDRNQEFLFARLAVRLVLDTGLLTGTADDLSGVLDGNHQGLFARAVTRLTQQNAVYEVLLEALALAQGRGLPIRDGIWATTAQALTNNDADTITDEHISALIDAAAPYLAVDTEHDQTVYRLAHKTFAEHLNPYLQNHLPAHTAHAGPAAWHTLADHTWVLDRLNPRAVVTHAFTQLFGRHRIPPEIAGVITAQHALSILAPSQRLVTRQIATTRCTATTHPSPHDINPAATWHLLWARMRRHPLHLTLTGHTDTVQAVAAFPGPDGRTLLATGSSDKTVRIWDPAAGTQVGDPLTSHTDPVRAVAVFPGPGGRTLLATGGGEETVRIWDPAAGTQVGDPLTGHTGGVRAASGSQLASSPACNASSACSSISGTGVATKPKNAHACAEKP